MAINSMIPIVFFTMIPLTAIGVPIARAIGRRIDREGTRAPVTSGDVTARLERMEQAIDSIAIEVERIAEGQRFTTKLLSDRSRDPLSPPGGAPEGARGGAS